MKRCSTIWLAVVSIVMILMLCSCSSLEVRKTPGPKIGKGNGPPAHAKAYGYRRKQVAGVEVVYQSKSGVYVVVGMPNHYYCDCTSMFYRLGPEGWQASAGIDGGWTSVTDESLPPGLRVKKNGKAKYMPLASVGRSKK